jgi:hypothetical protein
VFIWDGVLLPSRYTWVADAFSVEGSEYSCDVEIQCHLLYVAFLGHYLAVLGIMLGTPYLLCCNPNRLDREAGFKEGGGLIGRTGFAANSSSVGK